MFLVASSGIGMTEMPPENFSKLRSGGGSVIVWGVFSCRRTMELQVVQDRQTARLCRHVAEIIFGDGGPSFV